LQAEGVTHVDFLSVDIEGNEINALSGTDWDAVPIQLLLVETVWSSEHLDIILADAGFWRVADVGYADDLYVRGPRLLSVLRNIIIITEKAIMTGSRAKAMGGGVVSSAQGRYQALECARRSKANPVWQRHVTRPRIIARNNAHARSFAR
jgi:hypothetical protein